MHARVRWRDAGGSACFGQRLALHSRDQVTDVRYEITDAPSLGKPERKCWSAIQEAVDGLASPFLTPEFTDIVAAARRDVRVAVLEDAGSVIGFFPFQRSRNGFGRPVGGKLADHQGVIVPPRPDWDLVALLEAARLRSYSFDHLDPVHAQFGTFISEVDISPVLDLSGGYEAYREGVRAAGLGGPHEAEVKRRRLERRVGEVRLELHDANKGTLKTLIRWKSQQYRRTTGFDPLSVRWVREVIERVHGCQGPTFSGVLSSLYVGDRLAAVHLGLRSRNVLASWIPAYDVGLAKFSPGLVLLLMLAEAAAADGIQALDLGKGPESYKRRFTAGGVPVAVGAATVGPLASTRLRISQASWTTLLRTPLYNRAHRLRRRRQFR
jgi:CelD/BcsL family acetyltransferase involved in cellulose biosynthesis